MAGLILGVAGLLAGIIAIVQVSGVNKTVKSHGDAIAKIDTVENEARSAASAVDALKQNVTALQRSTQDAFTQVGGELGKINTELTKMAEAKPAAKPAGPGGAKPEKAGAPAVAGPDEYIVKAGDTGTKIARAAGVSHADLIAVNPNVNWSKLKVGDKIKLPAKKS